MSSPSLEEHQEPAVSPPPPPPPPVPSGPRRRFGIVRRLLAPIVSPFAHYLRRYLQASVEHELRETRGQLSAISTELTVVAGHLQIVQQRLDEMMRHNERLAEALSHLDMRTRQGARDLARLPGLFGPRFDELEIKLRPLITYDEESVAIRVRDGYVVAPRRFPALVVHLANASSKGLEPGLNAALRRLAGPGMIVADVGAGIGLSTLVLASATGRTGKVLAFEPDGTARAHLQKTMDLNGLSWVDVREEAAGKTACRKTFYVSDILGQSSFHAPAQAGEGQRNTIDVVRLDEVASTEQVDVVKIDAEGAELDVLSGMARLIDGNPDLAIVVTLKLERLAQSAQTPEAWLEAFTRAGFKGYMIDEATGTCFATDPKAVAKVFSANIAFVRPGGATERRLLRN